MEPEIFCLRRVYTENKQINGRIRVTCECTHSCDCAWTDHLTRRVGGVYAALSERGKDGARSFYVLSRRSLSLYELYNRFRVMRVAALQVVALRLSSVVAFACSREEPADRLLVVKKREEIHVSVVKSRVL